MIRVMIEMIIIFNFNFMFDTFSLSWINGLFRNKFQSLNKNTSDIFCVFEIVNYGIFLVNWH